MAAVIESRNANAVFDLHLSDFAKEISVDGVSQVFLGFPTSKVLFHSVTSGVTENKVEQRKTVLNLTISTLVLVQFCQQTLAAIASSESQLETAAQQHVEQLRQLLELVKPGETK